MRRSMGLLWLMPAAALLLISGVVGLYAQSLAEAAKKERARREQERTAQVKTLTEEDLKAVSIQTDRSDRRATSPAAGVGEEKGGGYSVPFTVRGNSMMVPVTLNHKAQTRLILDTGASLTSLSRAMAEAAGIQVSDQNIQLPMQTANGITMAPMVKLSALRIGELVIQDLDVVLLNQWADTEVTGLLGMNVLNQFNWQIDAARNRLVLKPGHKTPERETYGGYEKEWWSGQFRFLRESLEQGQDRLDKAAGPEEAARIKQAMGKLEAQLDTLTRAANRAGVPAGWRR